MMSNNNKDNNKAKAVDDASFIVAGTVHHDEGGGSGERRCCSDSNKKENSITSNNNKNKTQNKKEEDNQNQQQRKKLYEQTISNEEEEELDDDTPNGQQQQQRPNIKVFFGGELFNSRDLIGNMFLVEAIDKVSKGKYSIENIYLAQNQCNQKVTHQNIKDKDTIGVLNSDIALFAFEGTELDSGTVVEFIQAKTVDIPCVVYRTDIRGGSGEESIDTQCNKWNLMVSFYPRTKIVYLSSIVDYQKVYLQQQQVMIKEEEEKEQMMKNNKNERSSTTNTTSTNVCGDEEEKKMIDDDYEAIIRTEETSSSSLHSQQPLHSQSQPTASNVAMKYSEYIAQILINSMDDVLTTKPILSIKEKNHIKQQCLELWGINPKEISDSPYLM